MELHGLFHASAALTPRKYPWYQLTRRLDGPEGLEAPRSRPGRGGKKQPPEFEHRILYPIAQSLSSAYAIPAAVYIKYISNNLQHLALKIYRQRFIFSKSMTNHQLKYVPGLREIFIP
jgi:hypothetical protein